MKNNYAVIMAGGVGSRFWPMSKASRPKQFIDILGTGESLIQQTFRRLSKVSPIENIFVVTNKDYKSLCSEQLPEMKSENILTEPCMRNTAPCIAYAAFKIYSQNPDANLIVAPSDHLITNEQEFIRVVKEGVSATAANDILLTIGILPNRPDTGYGYIQFDEAPLESNPHIKKVKTFTEKPDQELALQFLDSGDFLWNSGIFIWNAEKIIKSFKKHLPDIHDIFEEGKHSFNTKKESSYIDSAFPRCKNISIDYGIMENSENVYVLPADFGWSDLGTWGSLYTHQELDNNRNTVQGKNVLLYDSADNIIKFTDDKVVVLQALNGYIVVEDNNTLLICKKEDEQKIKQFVADVEKKKR
ncbi:MAG: mannose-1-phosphate guanylyltransferase [Flavobacteriales bacterium TMED123]|nr:MAG: mannose-1-phosphate guanylyltransferase [Flavobacteriales bacterium TMED123]